MLSKKNQNLLKKCLDHWYENLMMLQLNHLSDYEPLHEEISLRGSDCAFCQEYHNVTGKSVCLKCPIKKKTGQTTCDGTPYYNIRSVLEYGYYEVLFKAIADEINFLESLKD